jgi:spermidine synthase
VRNSNNSNRIILTAKGKLPSEKMMKQRAQRLQQKLAYFGVDLSKVSQQITSTTVEQDWPENTKVLTDQFSPANLLNN